MELAAIGRAQFGLRIFLGQQVKLKSCNITTIKAHPTGEVNATPVAKPAEMIERRRFTRSLPVLDILEGDGSDADWDTWVKLSQGQACS